MRERQWLTFITFVLLLGNARSGFASLERALIPPRARGSGVVEDAIKPLSQTIGLQVANQIPTFSTSAGFTYEYNPTLEAYERSAKTFGPLFAERAVTLGKGKFNVNASYTWIRFDTFNGKNLDHLVSRVELADLPEGGRRFQGIRNADDMLTQLRLRLDIEAQLFDVSFTYGILDNLDMNIDIPILRTYAQSGLTDVIPDPRCVDAGAEDCVDLFNEQGGFLTIPEGGRGVNTGGIARATSVGVGDIRLRTKYLALREPVNAAGLFELILPSGSTSNFQGTGDTRLAASGIVSQDVLDRLELHGQAGFDVDVEDIGRSQARYIAGLTGQVVSFAAITVDLIGRSEFNPQGRIPSSGRLPEVRNGTFVQTAAELDNPDTKFTGRPYFVDIKRADVLNLAFGAKFAVGQNTIVFATALVPLNDDGLRAQFVPTFGIESTF